MKGIDVISNCFEAVQKNLVFFVPQLITLVVAAILLLLLAVPFIAYYASQPTATTNSTAISAALAQGIISAIPGIIVALVVLGFLGIVISAMYIDMTSKWKSGKISLSDSFNVALNRFFDLLLYSLMLLAIYVVLAVIILLPLIGSAASLAQTSLPGAGSSSMASLGTFVLGALGSLVLALIVIALVGPLLFTGATIVVLEGAGPLKALKASISIGLNDFWGILGVFFIFAIVYIVIDLIAGILGLIPLIGIVFRIAGGLLLGTISAILAPMYYITFAQGAKRAQKPAQPQA